MQEQPSARADIGLGVTLILVALAIIFGTLDLPEGSFEPLGSASIPQYVSGGVIVLSIWIIARGVARSRRASSQTGESGSNQELAYPLRPGLAVILVCLAIVYVGVMAMDWLRFSIATSAFIFVSVSLLSKFERRLMPAIVVLALALGIGLEYAFTQIFVIDLP